MTIEAAYLVNNSRQEERKCIKWTIAAHVNDHYDEFGINRRIGETVDYPLASQVFQSDKLCQMYFHLSFSPAALN
jgi:hypothetical protein